MSDAQNQDPNVQDPAYRILRDVSIDDRLKADIWDDFYESRNGADFKNRLTRFEIPDSLRNALLAARKSLEPNERERVVDAITRLSKLDPRFLATAEAHPTLLKYMLEAAGRESEG
jgi:hypothetical protein